MHEEQVDNNFYQFLEDFGESHESKNSRTESKLPLNKENSILPITIVHDESYVNDPEFHSRTHLNRSKISDELMFRDKSKFRNSTLNMEDL